MSCCASVVGRHAGLRVVLCVHTRAGIEEGDEGGYDEDEDADEAED